MKLAGASQGRSLVILLSLFAVVLLLRWAFLDQMDALAFDLGLRLRGVQAPDSRIAIVAVDDGSLDSVGSWPWPPETLNRLFDRILEADPKALGVDILLTLPASSYPSIATDPRVVLAAALGLSFNEGQPEVFWQEVKGLSNESGPTLGHIHADKDSGGICRSIPLGISHSGRRPLADQPARWESDLPLCLGLGGPRGQGVGNRTSSKSNRSGGSDSLLARGSSFYAVFGSQRDAGR